MIGGYLKSTSCIALVAAAGVVAGGVSAQAADLGGNCCADLEERVAELEATTVRKGNRRVSLQVYGQVSEAIIWWNDGAEKNVYVQENNNIKNIVGFQGNAKITSDWSAGYKLELQIRAYRSSVANQLELGPTNNVAIPVYNTQSVSLRHSYWFLRSNTWGTVTVGRDVESVVGTSAISLVNPDGFSGASGPGFINGGFFVRRAGQAGTLGLSRLTWQNLAYVRNGDGPSPFDYAQTKGLVKYTSPFFLGQTKTSGFLFSTDYGGQADWSVALRYVEDFGTFRFAAGVGYSNWRGMDRTMCSTGSSTAAGFNGSALDLPGNTGPAGSAIGSSVSCNSIQASASLLHVPTGLFISGGGAQMQDGNIQGHVALSSTVGGLNITAPQRQGVDGNNSFWWVMGGWEARLVPLGRTIFWGQYMQYDTGFGIASSGGSVLTGTGAVVANSSSNVAQTVRADDAINSLGVTAFIAGSQTRIWGGGITQNIDAAAMSLYLGFWNYQLDATLMNRDAAATNQRARANQIDDMNVVYTGATIRF